MPTRIQTGHTQWPWAAAGIVWLLAGLGLGTPAALEAATQAQIDAARNRGLVWLITHQRPDGSWRNSAGLEFAATATAVEALTKTGVRGYPLTFGASWLSNADAPSTDALARKILALTPVGLNVTPFLQGLIGWRNGTRTWGAYDRFETSFPDTPLALAAIRSAQYAYTDADYTTGLCAVLTAQKTSTTDSGSWSFIKPGTSPPTSAIGSAILPTTRNVLEIRALTAAKGWSTVACGTTYTITTVLNNAVSWLLAYRRDGTTGGFGEPLSGQIAPTVLETALVYEVLALLRPTDTPTGAALDYLLACQQTNGSWNGDAFQTAAAVRLLPGLAAPLADTDKDSLPDTVEALLGTNPALADSRWLANPYDGDLNQDGVVDAADVGLAEQILAGQIPLTPIHLYHGDVYPANQPDGVFDLRDLDRIRKKALGVEGF